MFRKECDIDKRVKRRNEDRPLKNMLVTGGAGFIGSNFINKFFTENPEVTIFNIDRVDYCSNVNSVHESIRNSDRYRFIRGDVCNSDHMLYIMETSDIDTIVHFAAASHVDNSFGNSLSFTRSNIQGTHSLLECARIYGKIEKFIHVSTDEVYGEVTESQNEAGFLNPTNPYAATKAAAEFIVKSYLISFNLPCIITRGNNVYGRYQYPEKIIPRFIMLLNSGKKLTIQGTGENTRTFIHASDVVDAFSIIVKDGIIGEIYNIGSKDEYSVMDIATRIISKMKGPNADHNDYIQYIRNRAFNDTRYDIDTSKLKALGWSEKIKFDDGLKDTITWYDKEALPSGFWSDIKMHIDCEDVTHPPEYPQDHNVS
eukprot:Tbor_TRINITY_DN2985_c0_g1::TRINITY_DN2985_c0_g1_i1::g.1034::m.1034/K12450/RHM; UDP-glucose 4,6-dehydratase